MCVSGCGWVRVKTRGVALVMLMVLLVEGLKLSTGRAFWQMAFTKASAQTEQKGEPSVRIMQSAWGRHHPLVV